MDNEKIDELLDKLNDIAMSYDHYDYGLPSDDVTKQMLRDAVVAWLEKILVYNTLLRRTRPKHLLCDCLGRCRA